MALLIGLVTRRELEFLKADGWHPNTLTPTQFRAFFNQDPRVSSSDEKIAFFSVNTAMVEIVKALGRPERRALRLVD